MALCLGGQASTLQGTGGKREETIKKKKKNRKGVQLLQQL